MQWNVCRRTLGVILSAAVTAGLAACGSSSKSSSSSSSSSAASSATAAKSGPGVGKPPVTLGDKNFAEEYVLGALYQQALAAKGYRVTLKGNIGSSEITYKALTSGQIDMYPEYTGTLLTTIAGNNKPPTSAKQTYNLAQAFVRKHGFVLTAQTPFYDSDALTTTKPFAAKHNLKSIADLKKLGTSLKLGGPPENRTRFNGLVGLRQLYGLNPTFVPLAIGITYQALDRGQVDVVTAFTTDPQLTTGKYTVLADPKKVFGFQNVAPVVKQSVVKAEGPAFVQTINSVSKLLTIPAVQKMNAAVSLEQQSPATVARQFLVANKLV
jgi:osmoprotectant transport system substrate-binding protein